MSIRSIKENISEKKIYITYEIKQPECLLEIELFQRLINFQQFSDIYLRLDTPFKYFGIEQQVEGFISLQVFHNLLGKVQNNPIKSASMDVIIKLLDDFEQIEEDLNQRFIHVCKLSSNPQFSNPKSANDEQLIKKIIDINSSTLDAYKNRNQNWQLLYVVETTVRQIWNGQEKIIIKLGKTDLPIEKYIIKLKKQYQGKIQFRPLFAQRLYTPGKTLVDTKYFHKKLLKSVPKSKLFFKANENEDSQIHYEFYYLTDEFVSNFEKLLTDFIDAYQEQYECDKESKEEEIKIDEPNDELNDEIQDDGSNDQIKAQKSQEQNEKNEKQEQILQQQTQQDQQQNDEQQNILQNLLDQANSYDNNVQDKENLQELTEVSKTLTDESFMFTNYDPQPNQKWLGIPIDYNLNDESQQIMYEASKLVEDNNDILKAFLYLATVKRQMKIEN